MSAYSIRIFLPDGVPDGLRIIEKSNWSGKGVVCPRALLHTAKVREEFTKAGVYILTGPAESGELPVIYVGEAETISTRLSQHASKKDFWTSVVFFVSKDDHLNKAHVMYLESRLCNLAQEAQRCLLDNQVTPSLPALSEADVADVEGFLSEILLCLPVIGVNVFEKPVRPQTTASLLTCVGPDADAKGYESSEGFVVLAGSYARREPVPSVDRHVASLRETLEEKGVFVVEGAQYRLTQDYVFNSPSIAAAVMLGRNANGRVEWKNEEGRTLKDLQEASTSDEE